MSEHIARFADDVFAAVEGYLARSLRPLFERLSHLEQREPERGKDASPEDIAEAVEAAVAKLPPARDGIDGKSVEPAEVEQLVQRALAALHKPLDGIDGAPGAKGIDGRDGKDGTDGRDGAAIEPLPSIDPARAYPRGTWAKHAGGLWLARTLTDGMTGWDCIVVGIAALEVTSDGSRNFAVKSLLSDGRSASAEFVLRTTEYRGAWAPGEYHAGDIVSWDGSMWHCEEASTTERPGTPAWRLSVKKGRDGKDGLRGARGERGTEGKPGRDYNGNRT
jgi:hypothetical protein